MKKLIILSLLLTSVLFAQENLFEMLCLEGAQAGLSWITILRKRENYKQLFDDFDAVKISKYSNMKIEKILQNPGIVRNKFSCYKCKSFLKSSRRIWEF